MKPILLFLLLLPMLCDAQKADSLACRGIMDTIKQKDEGRVNIRAKTEIIVTDTLGNQLFAIRLSKEIRTFEVSLFKLSIVVKKGAACLDDEAEITLFFKNGKKERLYSIDNFNCKGQALVTLNNPLGKIDKFLQNNVTGLSIDTQKGKVYAAFSEENKQMFHQLISCLAKSAESAKPAPKDDN